eukprot:c45485_g1_i1.p1 GENE.c45485_g1_i1~~c45485_g1_i1.p1  ORF type:complete len:417 (+),score=74.66 c45485_g1_i1:49-1299(+)
MSKVPAKAGFFASMLQSLKAKRKETTQRQKSLDLDEVFAYKTFKVVVYLDARLGLLHILLVVLILIYIVGFAIIFNKGYIEKEPAFGQIELHVLGKTHFKQDDQDLVVDALDLVDPPLEHGALFIASRRELTKQTRGICGNTDLECSDDSECLNSAPVHQGKCVDGLCQEMGWCPSGDTSSDDTQIWDFMHPENVTIWIKAAISFPKLAPTKTFTTMTDSKPIYESQNPEKGNAYYLYEILSLAEVPVKASRKDGAMINVFMQWECDVETEIGCSSPILNARRLDVGKAQGFWFADATYTWDENGNPDNDVRFYEKQIGYRLIVSSKGTGYKWSIQAIILQISSGLALVGAAKSAVDFIMLVLLPQKKYYRKYKEEETPDFSDVRELIKESEEQAEKLRGTGVSRYANVSIESHES